jgi:hypothetical protein
MRKLILGIAGFAIAGISLAACSSVASSPAAVPATVAAPVTSAAPTAVVGFNNPVTLAASVQSTFNTAANRAEDGYSVSGTSCIANSGVNTFTCIFTESGDGGQQVLTVTVAADGESWISKADD